MSYIILRTHSLKSGVYFVDYLLQYLNLLAVPLLMGGPDGTERKKEGILLHIHIGWRGKGKCLLMELRHLNNFLNLINSDAGESST